MKYTRALTVVTPSDPPRTPRARWVLTEQVRAFFAGEGWHGVDLGNLYDELDAQPTTYECPECGRPGDAAREDSAVEFIVQGYDPDVSPRTEIVGARAHHLGCRPSRISRAFPELDLSAGFGITLPAPTVPDLWGEYAITAHPVLLEQSDGWSDPEEQDTGPLPLLLLWARVVEDHGQGPAAWLHELEAFMRANAFSPNDSIPVFDDPPPQWVLRIASDYPADPATRWLALRVGPLEPGELPDHFFLGAPELPEEWVAAARTAGEVLVGVGPCLRDNDVPEPGADLDEDTVAELLEEGTLIVRAVPIADEHDPARLAPNARPTKLVQFTWAGEDR
ncbi:hypothetical protein SUDANB95_08000 (plasmid) [Actinosynnema sp. ALI-1.44]